MKVSLINITENPAELLIFTKQTRLNMSPGLFAEICAWPWERKLQELEYMARTIPSSWEFVNFTFLLEEVTRAFTHQLVRTRTGKYAQQTMRVLRVTSEEKRFGWHAGPTIQADESAQIIYSDTMDAINDAYNNLLSIGVKEEDARGILPTNIHTNIVAQFDLRTLSEMYKKRAGVRSQEEYRQALEKMVEAVIIMHPWLEIFIKPKLHTVVQSLHDISVDMRETDINMSNRVAKEADILKQELGQ